MKHLDKGRTLGRKGGHKRALMKNLAKSLILHEKMETSEAKAKELRPYIEKIITRCGVDTLHNRRIVLRTINEPLLIDKLFKVIGPKYKARAGGYTRIVKTGMRSTDAAKMAIIELV
jgi:large subunit ribosomal protein L17